MPNNENSAGPIIATIIILGVIVLGGLYFWGNRGNQTASSSDEATAAIQSQSSSDDLNSIQNDLNNTNTDNLGNQLNGS